MVLVAGLEPARVLPRWILSPLRLPFRHTSLTPSNSTTEAEMLSTMI